MDNIQPNPSTSGGNQPPRPISPPPTPPLPRPQILQSTVPPTPPKPPAPPFEASPKPIQPVSPPKPFGGIQVPSSRPLGDMQPKAPPPPPLPTAEARSLKSDIESLKASGGASPRPQIIKLEEMKEAPIFKPGTLNQMPGAVAAPSSMVFKKFAKILGGLVVVVGLGLLGYYVVYPLVFPAGEIGPSLEQQRPPLKKAEAPLPHQSLFLIAPDAEVKISLTSLTPPDIFGVVQTEALSSLPAGSIKELAISDTKGQVAFADYAGSLLEIGPESIRAITNDDFSGFVYYDSKGAWPGYVASLKSSVSPSEASGVLAQLEEADVRRFYVNDPGINDTWKDGPYKGYPVRYSSFSAPGASLNYGILGNYVVISTSFDGLKKAVEYLGL